MRLKEMHEQRAKLIAEVNRQRDIVTAADNTITAEQEAAFNAACDAVDAMNKKIEAEQRANDLAALDAQRREVDGRKVEDFRRMAPTMPRENVITERDRADALRGWLAYGKGAASEQQVAAMRKCGINPTANEIELQLFDDTVSSFGELQAVWRHGTAEQRAAMLRGNIGFGAAGLLTTGASAGAGFIAPGSMASAIVVAMLQFGGVRRVSQIFTTDNGEPFKIPTANDTGNTGELVSEQGSIGSTVDATISSKTLGLYKFSSKLMKNTVEMREDTRFDLPTFLGNLAGERLGRITNTYQTTGTGSSQPQGIVVGSAAGVSAIATGAVSADELIELIHAVDPAYVNPQAGWMFNNNTAKALRKLKSGEGEYIWRDNTEAGIANGFSSTLFGYGVTINQDMADMSTGTKPILFGQLSAMKIRTMPTIRIRRLVELYAATDEEGTIAFIREDAAVVDAGTHPIKRITMA